LKFLWLVCVAIVACRMTPAGALEWHPGGSVAVTSDYVFRGVSRNCGQITPQFDLHVQPSASWSLGAWVSPTCLLPDNHSSEINLYLQWRRTLSENLGATAGAVYYTYPNDPRSVPYDYAELTASLKWRDAISLSATWAPGTTLFSTTGRVADQQIWTTEIAATRRFASVDTQLGVGYFTGVGLSHAGYAYGSASAAQRWGRWRGELSYIWVQSTEHRRYAAGPAGGPWTATLSWHF
jgi:uncharacterized protein (TIGR02001 family)